MLKMVIRNNDSLKLLSVFLGFLVMGFIDIVGIATNYIEKDFLLSETLANLVPMMVFFWFAVCAIPTGIIMSKVGRKNTVLLALGITFVAMFSLFVFESFLFLLFSFALVGIGNTILQVSLNAMVPQIVPPNSIASILTMGQFVKAVSSFLGPIIASIAVLYLGNWKLLFVVCMTLTVLASVCLLFFVESDKSKIEEYTISFSSVFALLYDKVILMLFIGILFIVGVDVGLNVGIPKLLMEKTNLSLNEAGLGISLYFISKTVGAFIGAFLLSRIVGSLFMRICMIVSLVSFIVLLLANELWLLFMLILVIGFATSSVFSILFSYALQRKTECKNGVSSLMIMGVSGGALVTPIMGVLSDLYGITVGLSPLLFFLSYLLWISRKLEH